LKPLLRRVHRYVALTLAVLWLSQALTGLLMVFRWELDDAPLAGGSARVDVTALAARVADIESGQPGHQVVQLYATGGVPGRFDLYVRDAQDATTLVRVDGRGEVLRTRASDDDIARMGFIPAAATLHQTLFAGDVGKWIVGLSGALLFSSIIMGAVLAWPARPGQWLAVLRPRNVRPGAARRHAWHRAVGLWLAAPALVLVGAGMLMTIESSLERWLGQDAVPVELTSAPQPSTSPIGLDRALAAAMQRFPAGDLSGVAFPTTDRPWYRIRLRQPDEWRRVYGTTVVYVSAADGRVLRVDDALAAPAARAFLDNLYPIHTGEAGGVAGRWLALAVGAWLFAMLLLGTGLWHARRGGRR
jgi:uncharacterized iron-regulated membrane protein